MNERILDHVGIAVPSLDEALPIWEPILGAPGHGRETVAAQGVEVVFLGSGAGRVELLAPVSPDSAVARFLTRHGPGMHHLCYRVPDIRSALAELAAEGYELIDEEPRPGAHGHLVAFLHPRAAGGVLVELLEAAP
ncbi:MAG TPA: methylmalonyl-CoA epimerase [Longimicrobiaceae bacterium]|nr:methylmalonyl-CoA epimerase [Longimicrobiaceae bacterium]